LERVVSAETARGWLGAPVRIIMVSLAAQILTVPLVMFHFQQVSIISLVANAVVVPAQPPALLFGGLAIVVGLISPALGQIVGWVAWLFLNYTVNAVRVLAQIPFATLPASISLSTLLLIYVALAGVTWVVYQDMERRQALFGRIRVNLPLRAATGGALVLALLTVAWSNSQPDGLLHVFFFDVGQGDAVFIQTPSGRQLLVDAGYYPSIINEQLGRQMPFWDRSLDMVIATHPDADHVSGLPGVLTRYQVGRLVTDGSGLGRSDIYDAVILKAAEEGVPLHSATAGEIIEIGDGVRLEIVHPGAARSDVSRNDNSVSVRLVYGAFSLLLTGDAEDSAERAMLSQGLPLRSLVYKAGHHGAQTSSSAPFLDVVQPQVAIISAGADNRFGHPHPDVLARLAERGVTVLSTIDLGTIEVISDGSQMWWQSWR
jgi:competence protein ComEC